MRIIKPLQISHQHKVFRWKHKHYLSVSHIIGFRMGDRKDVLSEQDLWRFLPPLLGPQGMLDACMPKPHGEVLVFGSYHAPGGRAVTADRVEISAGDLSKSLAVIGDRYWRPMIGPTPPEPFTRMPIDYSHAFGGTEHVYNTIGKGIEEIDYFGEMRQPLPNIEDPNHLITSPGQRPQPAGLGPLDMMWRQRASKMGTYDDDWRLNHFPGLPPDIDWTHFMTAPKDQWLTDFWRGDERFSILNMHPGKQQLSGKLPGFRTRCLIEKIHQGGYREISMKAETLYLFPEHEIAVLLYRGSHEVDEDDASDVANLLVAYEDLTQPARPASHYAQAIRNRLDEKTEFKYMMNTTDIIPDSERCGFVILLEQAGADAESIMVQNIDNRKHEELKKVEASIQQEKDKLEQQLRSAGLDPAPFLDKFKLDPTAGMDDPFVQQVMEMIERILPGASSGDAKQLRLTDVDFSALKQLNQFIADLAEQKKQQVRDELTAIVDQATGTPAEDQVRAKINAALDMMQQPPELPRPSAQQAIDEIRQQVQRAEQTIARMRAQGLAEAQIPRIDPQLENKLQAMQDGLNQLKHGYRGGAHYVEGRPPHRLPLDILRHRFEKALNNREDLRDRDLAGVDLSSMDLSNRDLSGCYLEYANLSDSNLSGARLDQAIMTHANLSRTNLKGASLVQANLGGSRLHGADLSGAITQGTEFSKADLNGAKLIGCQLADSNFLETNFSAADLSGSDLSRSNFLELNFDGAVFQNCKMSACNFVKSHLQQVDFTGAVLDEANFVGCECNGSRFGGASMLNVRFVAGCSLRLCNFNKARLDRANLRDSEAEHASFEEASFNMADFSGANLQHGRFYGAVGKRALFMKSDLMGADFSSVNLMEGSLMKARLTNTNLRNSNLYAVEFMDATVGGSDFAGSNLDLTKLEDWRPSR